MQRAGRRVEVTVLGHRYPVRTGGAQGDEARIREAEKLLNARLEEIEAHTGEISGLHLAVMAALSLADEVVSARHDRQRERADEASFRQTLRERSEKLLALVEAELEARKEAAGG